MIRAYKPLLPDIKRYECARLASTRLSSVSWGALRKMAHVKIGGKGAAREGVTFLGSSVPLPFSLRIFSRCTPTNWSAWKSLALVLIDCSSLLLEGVIKICERELRNVNVKMKASVLLQEALNVLE